MAPAARLKRGHLLGVAGLGYRVEQSDRINFRLVVVRGWPLGAVLGGPVRWRHVWMNACVVPESESSCRVEITYRGVGRAMAADAQACYAEEVAAFQARCRSHPPPRQQTPGHPPERVLREVFIKEVVRIPCRYCGALVDNTAKRCDACGAPLG